MFEVIVVGGGIMGASAARHLARRGTSLAVVAPPEPTSPADPGPHGAHYDVSRLIWLNHADPVEKELARRSLAAVDEIEAFADHRVFSGSGQLFVADPGQAEDRLEAARQSATSGELEWLTAGQAMHRHPGLALHQDATVLMEPAPSGWFDPRELVAAQLRAAESTGAVRYSSPAVAIDDGVVTLRDGTRITGEKVLVSAGAYVNAPGLLPRPVALRLKTETVLMATVPPQEAERLADIPPIIYALDDDGVDDVYMAPPLRYPDGRLRLKWGANTIMDRWVHTTEEVDNWYRARQDPRATDIMSPTLLRMFPGLRVDSYETVHCVVAYTGHGMPYIDTVEPGHLYIAAGGNGHSAKWSAALGELAASLVQAGEWTDPLPGELFRVQWEGDVEHWAGVELLADRRR